MATSSIDEILKYVAHLANKMDGLCEDVKEIKEQIGNMSTLSGVGKGGVSDAELAELARVISSRSMSEIAITCLGFEAHEIEYEQMGARDHQWKFNFKILTTWRNKCTEDDSRQVLAKALQNAARSSGGLNFSNVQKILGIYEDNSSINQNEKEAGNEPGSEAISGNEIQAASGSCNEREPELTYEKVFNLARQMISVAEIRTLGYRGLRLETHRVEAHLGNNPLDITRAAYQMLLEWLHSQPNGTQAYRSLCQALKEANMVALNLELYY